MNERWGAANQSYYTLSVSYFSNPTASALMSLVSRDMLWARMLSSTSVLEADARDLLPGRLAKVGKNVELGERALAVSLKSKGLGLGAGMLAGGGGSSSSSGSSSSGSSSSGSNSTESKLPESLAVGAGGACADAVTAITSLASELLRAQAMQATKRTVFCACHGMLALATARAAARGGAGSAGIEAAAAAAAAAAGPSEAPQPQPSSFASLASSLEVASSKVTRQ